MTASMSALGQEQTCAVKKSRLLYPDCDRKSRHRLSGCTGLRPRAGMTKNRAALLRVGLHDLDDARAQGRRAGRHLYHDVVVHLAIFLDDEGDDLEAQRAIVAERAAVVV